MPRGIQSEHLDNTGWMILKATLEQKKTLFLFPERESYETTLADLRSVANMIDNTNVTFDGEAHKITHNVGCTNEISVWAYTIYGEVKE